MMQDSRLHSRLSPGRVSRKADLVQAVVAIPRVNCYPHYLRGRIAMAAVISGFSR